MNEHHKKQTGEDQSWDEESFWELQDQDTDWDSPDDWYDQPSTKTSVLQRERTDTTKTGNQTPTETKEKQDEEQNQTSSSEETTEALEDKEEAPEPEKIDESNTEEDAKRAEEIDPNEDLDLTQIEEGQASDWENEAWEQEDEAELKQLADEARKQAEERKNLEESESPKEEESKETDSEDTDELDESEELNESEATDEPEESTQETKTKDSSPSPKKSATGNNRFAGKIKETDPSWVSSFQGGKGYAFVFLFAFLIYAIFAGKRFNHQSDNPHFVYLADSYLKGQWALDGKPKSWLTGRTLGNDWAYVDEIKPTRINGKPVKKLVSLRGRWFYSRVNKRRYFVHGGKYLSIRYRDVRAPRRLHFVSFPPMPALLMAAPMYLLGKLGYPRIRFNDTLFSLFFAGLSVLLMFMVLQKLSFLGYSNRSLFENLQLTILFAFGSVFFYVAVQGTVWFTALVVGAFFSLAFLWFAFDGRWPLLAGLCVGAAFLTRPLLIFLSIFYLLWVIRKEGKWTSPFQWENFKKLFLFALPVAAILGGMMAFNFQRFGNPFEFGHNYLPAVFYRSMQYGLFHPHWFARNFYAFFLAPPELFSHSPYIRFNGHGMSMFLTTPALIFLLFTPKYKRTALFWSLVTVILLIMLPQLFYQNTGWVTFGNRFSIDYMPLLIVALAVCGVHFRGWWSLFLWFAIALNTFGAATFNRQFIYYKVWPYNSMDWVFKLFS